jgi:uncharacterized RDD family membrane protein YckC
LFDSMQGYFTTPPPTYQTVTPFHDPLSAPVEYAGFLIRFLAWVIDIVILLIPLILIFLFCWNVSAMINPQGAKDLEHTQRVMLSAKNQTYSWYINLSIRGIPDCTQPNTGPKEVCERARTYTLTNRLFSNSLSEILICAYYVLLTSSKLRGTLGKKLLGLQVVDEEGHQVRLSQSLIRYSLLLISGITTIAYPYFFLIGYVNSILGLVMLVSGAMVAFDDRKRGLHDKMANTFVIKTRKTLLPSQR